MQKYQSNLTFDFLASRDPSDLVLSMGKVKKGNRNKYECTYTSSKMSGGKKKVFLSHLEMRKEKSPNEKMWSMPGSDVLFT